MEPPEEIQKRMLLDKRETLHISRIPPRVKEEFTAWAHQEFCGDYGLALKSLWEQRTEAAVIYEALGELQSRVLALEQGKPEETKERRMVSGKKIPIRM